jgi:hypothetical protein
MTPVSGSKPCYIVRISSNGAEAFGWEICREADSIVIHRSTRLFATRIEAIFDSARAAATLRIAIIESSSDEGENCNGD